MYSRISVFLVSVLLLGVIISSTYSYYIFKIYISDNEKRQELTNLEYDEKIAQSKLNTEIFNYKRETYRATQELKRNIFLGVLASVFVTSIIGSLIYARYQFNNSAIREVKIGDNIIPVKTSQLTELSGVLSMSLVSLSEMAKRVDNAEFVSQKYREVAELSLNIAQMNLSVKQENTTQFPVFQTVSSSKNPYDLFLGVDEQNNPCISSYIDELKNIAVMGTSGSGKTQFLVSQILQLAYRGCIVRVIDPQVGLEQSLGTSLKQYGIKSLRSEDFEMYFQEELSQEISGRKLGARTIDIPYIVVLDELPSLIPKYGKILERSLEDIVDQTRKLNIFTIMSAQHGTGKHFGNSVIRDGVTTKIAFSASPNDAENLFQNPRFVDMHSRLQKYQFLRVTSGIPEQVIQAVQLPESDGLQFRAAIESRQQLALTGE